MNSILPLLCLFAGGAATQDPPGARETVREAFPDGSPRVEAEAVRAADGSLRLDGKYVRFHPDGSRECVGRYRDGERHGSWRFLHPGGEKKRAEGSYKSGWRDGAWKAWTPDGKFDPTESGTYRQLDSRHPGGEPLAAGETLDGVPHGRWELKWPSGAPLASGELQRGRLHGTWLFQHQDGSLDADWITGVYEHGRRAGDVPATEPAQGPEPDLGRLPPLAVDAGLPVGVVEEARAAVARLRAHLATADTPGREREGDLALLARLGRGVDGLILAPLLEFDLADADGALQAERWERGVMRGAAQGRRFGLARGTDAATQARNRRCVLRWHSLLALGRVAPRYLEFDLRHPYVLPGEVGPDDETRFLEDEYLAHRTPALPIPGLDSDVARAAMHPRLAPRLASRRVAGETWGKPGARALDAALAWLVAHQSADGRWSGAGVVALDGDEPSCACDVPGHDVHDSGLTGLALLALLGDGSTPHHGRHAAAVRRGVDFLVSAQSPAGLLAAARGHGFIYDHAIATQALCEAAALCDDEGLRQAARRAIDLCLSARNPTSAWRYELKPDNTNDTSVTGWMVAALKAGEAAGLAIDPAAYRGALAWIDKVTDVETGRCGYDSTGSYSARIPEVNDHYPAEYGEAMTAVALLCRHWIEPGNDPAGILGKQAALLRQRLPDGSTDLGRDMYYWYHGAQAMHRRGGSDWAVWYRALQAALLDSQRADEHLAGSWDPVGPWGYAGGRIYATALMALCLETPYRHTVD